MVVAAALIDPRGRVLVQQRPAGRSLAGLWEFPGGKIEAGETPEAALTRELHEEIAVTATEFTPLSFASEAIAERHLVMLLYLCRRWAGVAAPLHASALQWVEPAALYRLAMPPADLPLIPKLVAAV